MSYHTPSVYTNAAEKRQSADIVGSGLGDSEGWVLTEGSDMFTSCPDLPKTAYLDYQLRTRFGTFSFEVRPSTMNDDSVDDNGNSDRIHSQMQSPLFSKIPGELRHHIYEQLLCTPTSCSGLKLTNRAGYGCTPKILTVLLTCRRILAEAEHIFYSLNRFRVEKGQAIWSSLGSRRRNAITKVTLRAVSASAMLIELQQLRRQCPNLKSLHMERAQSVRYLNISSWKIMVPQLVAEIQKMRSLADIQIIHPEVINMTGTELERASRIAEVDQKLSDAARSSV